MPRFVRFAGKRRSCPLVPPSRTTCTCPMAPIRFRSRRWPAARVLTRLGGKAVTDEMLRADIDAGAPTNADGTVNLVHYAAWLVKEMAAGGD